VVRVVPEIPGNRKNVAKEQNKRRGFDPKERKP
jgi:hypothetical protein